MAPHPAVAQVRLAVRRCLSGAGLEPGDLVLAACSGGADSLALASALAFQAPRLGLRGGGVTVDHGLQAGSDEQARKVTKALKGMGLDPVDSVAAAVARAGDPGFPGPEAAARAARYVALRRAASVRGATAVLLGHTRDDQAETVLLGLARGSGARSLAGMPQRNGLFLRPLLEIGRATTRAACTAQGLAPWDDPQNADPAYARVRVRARLLPALESELGPGVTEALARSARLLRADAEFLDELAKSEWERLALPGPGHPLPLTGLAGLPGAIRSRVLRNAAIAAGCPPGALTARHVAGLEALVTGWRGQRWADLPGGIRARRRYGKLQFGSGDDVEGAGGRE